MKTKQIALFVFFVIHYSNAEELATNYTFDPAFINIGNDKKVNAPDLSYFSHADGVLPGEYLVDVKVNNESFGTETIRFVSSGKGKVVPLLTETSLKKWGVDVTNLNITNGSILSNELSKQIKGFEVKFNKSKQILSVNIPQSWIYRPVWSEIPPQAWDDGETSLLVNYRYSDVRQRLNSTSKNNQSLAINSGLNIGGWRVRHNGYWNSSKYGWTNLNTYLRHDYSFGQGGQLTFGQSSTDDGVFESFPFEGISIGSDDGMLVPWMSTYSPTIRGIAFTPSQIIVKQNNMIIWHGDVPAGPFELQDVFPLYGGDMDIEIRESNGEIRHFTQSSSTLPILQRKGRMRYHAAIGKYRDINSSFKDKPLFLQYSTAWGIGWDTTIFGGIIVAENYSSASFGVGKYISSIGAFSLDLSYSDSDTVSKDNGKSENGSVTRLMFAKGFESTGTYLNLTEQLYNSQNFYSFNDYQQMKIGNNSKFNKINRITTQLQQSIGNTNQLTLSSDWTTYRNAKDSRQFRLSYSFPVKKVFTSLSLNYNKQPQYEDIDKSVYLSVSVPFSSFSNYSNASLTTNVYNSGNSTNTQAGVSGYFIDQQLYYSFMEGYHSGSRDSSSGNATLRYKSAKGEIQSTVSHQHNSKQLQFGISGGVVVHKKGIVLSQPLSLDGANALIDTNGVEDIKVKRGIGISTDFNGYAVVPYLSPYRKNGISLDVNKVNEETEIIKSDLTVVPSRGALVHAKFNVVSGHKALITLIRKNGNFVPFGAIASLKGEAGDISVTSIVSNDGQVWMSGMPDRGEMHVQWGDNKESQCSARFELKANQSKISRLSLVCE
ncbi:TPA: fimbrial biogenesis outer membrane usher protein [Escherichia coli]|uniref:fimbria/pilus outer membrane usher protein n=1 Tax=Escherichia coli TaxID=562 RepID=UPI0019927BE4|nr:fimbrial biogenesis outer membrane usher protein [Escherichia coli]MCN5023803.1 fimbrial biogenesis outer membrane usher protein [Escherichia coli]HAL6398166.1 fimbrial biogenesis outer membrane usher protein [Escherichia coli]HAL6859611.1 fimbrial biogenesis outer membrane usher protein [Escherichia coli]HCT5042077.1 fimbrial biogenesis outer membrane usher protein [Escherichia coli]